MSAAGEQVCFFYELHPGSAEEYEQRHREVWPDLLAMFGDAGISDYSIFRRGTQLVCVLRATPDWETVRARVQASPLQQRWTDEQRHLFARVAEDDGTELFAERVFRFDG